MCLSEEGPALLAHRAGIRLHTIRLWLSVALKFGEIFWVVVDWGKRGLLGPPVSVWCRMCAETFQRVRYIERERDIKREHV